MRILLYNKTSITDAYNPLYVKCFLSDYNDIQITIFVAFAVKLFINDTNNGSPQKLLTTRNNGP